MPKQIEPNLSFLAVLVLILVLCILRTSNALPKNLLALHVKSHIERRAECALAGSKLEWKQVGPADIPLPYLQAVAASAGAPNARFPNEINWSRDPRLLAWFQAQYLIEKKRFSESIPYLRQARAADALIAAGHRMGQAHERSCRIFNWLVAQEIGTDLLPDLTSWVLSLIEGQQAATVAEGYERALVFAPGRNDWRLILARALLASNKSPDAEAVLRPVLQGTAEERAKAREVLHDYHKRNN